MKVTMTQREAWAIEYAEQYIKNWELYIVAKSAYLAGVKQAGDNGDELVDVSMTTHQIGAKCADQIQEG